MNSVMAHFFVAAQKLTCGNAGGEQIALPNCGKDVTQSTAQQIVSLSSEVAGAVCLLILVIAGLRYVISAGNPEAITKSKNAMIYAAVGLVVCISAYMIVTFVVSKV